MVDSGADTKEFDAAALERHNKAAHVERCGINALWDDGMASVRNDESGWHLAAKLAVEVAIGDGRALSSSAPASTPPWLDAGAEEALRLPPETSSMSAKDKALCERGYFCRKGCALTHSPTR